MTAIILAADGSDRIVTFDAVLDELHETVSEITEHPVEVGVSITDHVRPRPDRFNMVGFVTNQPIVVNPFTQRGELVTHSITPPQYDIPFESPGAIYRAGLGAIDGAIFGGPEGSAQLLTFPDEFDAIRETYEMLLELQKNAVLLEVYTSIQWYQDLILESVGAPRMGGNTGVAFALNFRQLRVVESGQVASPPIPAEPRGASLKPKGSQSKKPKEKDDITSLAYSVIFG